MYKTLNVLTVRCKLACGNLVTINIKSAKPSIAYSSGEALSQTTADWSMDEASIRHPSQSAQPGTNSSKARVGEAFPPKFLSHSTTAS